MTSWDRAISRRSRAHARSEIGQDVVFSIVALEDGIRTDHPLNAMRRLLYELLLARADP